MSAPSESEGTAAKVAGGSSTPKPASGLRAAGDPSEAPPPPESGVLFRCVPGDYEGDASLPDDSEAGDNAFPAELERELEFESYVDAKKKRKTRVRLKRKALEEPTELEVKELRDELARQVKTEVIDRMVAHLRFRKGVPAQDVEDVWQTTFVRAMQARSHPAIGTNLVPWLRAYSNFGALNYFGKRKKARGRETLDEDMDRYAKDPSPPSPMSTAMGDVYDASSEQVQGILVARAQDAPVQSIAEEYGVTQWAVYQTLRRVRERVEKRWLETTTGLVALALAFFFGRVQTDHRPLIDVAVNDRPMPVLAPALEPSEVRRYALDLCNRGEYRACLDRLDRAERGDPEGDKAAAVQTARKHAREKLFGPDK
jgi:DNA-directed RNA polymerase specialized sigma24 family protein